MVCQQLGPGFGRMRKALLEHLADAGVQLLALGAQQAAIGGILEQRVLELVGDLGHRAAAEQKLRLDQLGQRLLERHLAEGREGRQQLVAEHAPERRGQLGDLLHRRELVEARHQRIVQRGRDRQRRQRAGQHVAVARIDQQVRLQDRLGQLLDEQRHAVGPGDDLLDHLERQRLAAGDALDHGGRLTMAQPAERERADVRIAAPGRREVGPKDHHQQDRQALDPIDDLLEQLDRGGVDPMRVLEDHQHRIAAGEPGQLIEQGGEHLGAVLLRREVERRIAALGRDRQERRQQRCRLPRARARLAEQGLQLLELDRGRIVAAEIGGALELVEHRIERAAGVEGRAEVVQVDARLLLQLLAQALDEARLADPGLARQQHHLALAVLGLAPARQQHTDLVLAPDQGRQPARRGGLEARGAGRLAHPVHRDRRAHAPDRQRAEVVADEQALDQAIGAGADHDAAGLGQVLQAGGDVGRLADHRHRVAALAGADVAHHHEPGVDADPDRQLDARLRHRIVQRGDRLDHAEPGADRPLGVVLVRPRIAEIRQDAVADVVADMAAIAADHLDAGFLEALHDVAQILRIEPGRELGRADQVAEHHGQVAALGQGDRAHRRGRRRGRLHGGLAEGGNRAQQLLAVAERDAERGQVLVVEIRQDVEIDVVVGEDGSVAAEAELLEPLIDLRHLGVPWHPTRGTADPKAMRHRRT